MWRLLFELGIWIALIYGIYHFRNKYRKSVIHHHDAAIMWQRMMMNIMSEQIGRYFKETHVNNHIVCLRGSKIDISIGDEETMVPVNMDLFKEDVDKALDEAYNRFVSNVR